MERIILALDGMNAEEAIETAKKFSDKGIFEKKIWGVKINDLLDDNNPQEIIPALKKYGESGTKVFVDAKLHDIPQTVFNRAKKLATAGADFITVHASGEIDMMMAAVDATKGTSAKILAVTVLTSLSEEEIHLNYGDPAKAKVLELARNAALAGVHGIVCSPKEVGFLNKRKELKNLIKITPGVRIGSEIQDQKRVDSPDNAILDGANLLVVGRPILKAEVPGKELNKFNDIIYNALKEKLALKLFDNGNVKFGAFKLKLHEKNPDAPLSPIYFNLRNMPDEFYSLAAELMVEVIKEYGYKNSYVDYDCLVGVPKAGEPFAEALGKLLKKDVFGLEKIDLADGKRKIIISSESENALHGFFIKIKEMNETKISKMMPGCILIDDVITEADSKIEAIDVLQETGIFTDLVLVLVNREQGGKEKLAELGKHFSAVYSLTEDLLPFYLKNGKITTEQFENTMKYIWKDQYRPC